MRECRCKICKRSDRVDAIREKLGKADSKFLGKLYEELLISECDLELLIHSHKKAVQSVKSLAKEAEKYEIYEDKK